MDDLERFAIRLAAEWHDDSRSGSCAAALWLDQFATLMPMREPDSCPDALCRLPGCVNPVRWYDDGDQVTAFRDARHHYVIPWSAVEAFLRQSLCCEDDEVPPASESLPLAG